jgi:ABC-type multidrug transport system ATPase subunit
VSTLCSSFAIICQGEVLYAGDPEIAVKELDGKIYSKAINQSEINYHRDVYKVISTQLKSGKLHIRILHDENQPLDGFVSAIPNLEDVYFSNIATRVDVNTM